MRYRKVEPGGPLYELIQEAKKNGSWVCDAWDHNNSRSCPNPKCFKYKHVKKGKRK